MYFKDEKKEESQSIDRPFFEDHLTLQSDINLLIEKGELFTGNLRINPKNQSIGYVTISEFNMDVQISGMRNLNRSVDGDIVYIQLYQTTKWSDYKQTKKKF